MRKVSPATLSESAVSSPSVPSVVAVSTPRDQGEVPAASLGSARPSHLAFAALVSVDASATSPFGPLLPSLVVWKRDHLVSLRQTWRFLLSLLHSARSLSLRPLPLRRVVSGPLPRCRRGLPDVHQSFGPFSVIWRLGQCVRRLPCLRGTVLLAELHLILFFCWFRSSFPPNRLFRFPAPFIAAEYIGCCKRNGYFGGLRLAVMVKVSRP